MKKALYIIVVLIFVTTIILSCIYLNKKSIDNAYNYAITLIQNGSYEGMSESNINKTIDVSFCWYYMENKQGHFTPIKNKNDINNINFTCHRLSKFCFKRKTCFRLILNKRDELL